MMSINYFTSGEHARAGLPPGSAVPVIYTIGRASRLFRLSRAPAPFGRYMAISIAAYTGGVPAEGLAAAILSECARQRFSDVILFAPEPAGHVHIALARYVASVSASAGIKVWVCESAAEKCGSAGVLLCASVSSGYLSEKLKNAISVYGRENVALEICRACADYVPPARGSRALTRDGLRALITDKKPEIYYSSELCVRYFNYRDGDNTHFVLFDDAFSLGQKLALGGAMGVGTAFFYYSEVSEIICELEKHRQA